MTPEKLHQPLARGWPVSVYLYVAVPLAVLATPLEILFPGSPGQMAFVLLLPPVLMAAFDGGFRSSLLTGLTAGAGVVGAGWLAQWSAMGGFIDLLSAALPVGWAVTLVGCGCWLGRSLDIVRARAADVQARCEEHERAIYRLYKESSEAAQMAEQERLKRQQEESTRLDFSRLLLNIQHLGRELSGNLQMNAAFRLVTEAARKLLKARNPRLFLLDDQTQELVERTPDSLGGRRPAGRGVLGWVVRQGQIITAEDIARHHALADLRQPDEEQLHACAPLMVGQRPLGVLAIDSPEQKTPEFDRLLYIVANFSAVALNNGQLFQQVQEMARRDGLTGLLNHATFQSELAEMVKVATPAGKPLSVIISDIDHFKQFNDHHGHQAGDVVLRSVAQLWQRLIPRDAIAARYGGEEFVCVLPGTPVESAAEVAESLRFALEHEPLQFGGVELKVTASFGVATLPEHADSPAALVRQADEALYAAKRAGRNRVCLPAGDTSGTPAPDMQAAPAPAV